MFRISTNVAALSSMRYLSKTGRDIVEITERLSSGLRVNKARDDAAAMFISEQLRSQIATLKQANRNVGQAATLLQVMEGGLEQMTGILTRLKELAIQAADGAYSDAQRLKGIQVEGDQLIAELNRLVAGITFNGITLFPDNDTSLTFQVGETQNDRVNLGLSRINADTMLDQFATKVGFIKDSSALTGTDVDVSVTGQMTFNTGGGGTNGALLTELNVGDLVHFTDGTVDRQFFVASITDDNTAQLDMELEGQLSIVAGSGIIQGVGTKFQNQVKAGDTIILGNGVTYTVDSVDSNTQLSVTLASGTEETFTGSARIEFGALVDTTDTTVTLTGQLSTTNGSTTVTGIGTKFTEEVKVGDTIDLNGNSLVVSGVDSDTQLTLSAAATATDSGTGTITRAGVKRVDAAGQFLATDQVQDFLNQIADGIDTVISQRARLGAIQSRLERAAETNAIQVENALNADSVIRDADMAEEISNLVRAQILAQAGTSVLNQANLLPQNVLNLLAALS